MKNVLKRVFSFILVLVIAAGMMPITAHAAVDSTGKPTDLKNTLVLSIYTPEGSFPGEPAMHGSEDYISFNSKFAKTSASGKFKDDATSELELNVLDDMVQGTSNGSNTVWGVFSADGLKEKYFKPTASIIQPENEAKIIRVIKGNAVKNMTDEEILDEYEIIWYVIKLQHSPGNGWWNRATTEWHIDGLIKEKDDTYVTVNYYGNGNTEGSAPDGITNHIAGQDYVVQGNADMKKKINGVYVDFLGWSAKADGTGEETGFYKAGDVIEDLDKNISLYAMWDTTTQYTATVNTYLDGVLTSDDEIHGEARDLYLSTDEIHYYKIEEGTTGVYTAKITGNGKFHLYNKDASGEYTRDGNHQLTIYNQNGTLDVHHYSVTYNPNGGELAEDTGKHNFIYGEAVTAIEDVPEREGYLFLGWNTKFDGTGTMIQPGEEVTASITEPVVLYAQWEETVTVTVNVTVKHEGGDGYDQAPEKDHVVLTVASKPDAESPFLEVGETMTLTSDEYTGFQYSYENKVTKYESYTLTDMPGGTAQYTVVTSKSGYETNVEHHQDAEGNWIINVEMVYKPSNFDLTFNVEVDESVPDQYVPTAAIVKVTFWASGKGCWEIITQQAGNEPGVRVDIDPATRTGSGSYPVWKYESNGETPYGYRIEITSFVYPDGTIVPVSKVLQQDVQWTDNVYTVTVDDVTGGKLYNELNGAYYHATSDSQKGRLNAVITMELYDVTFHAMGGKVNGLASQTVEDQYKIPGFNAFVPTRDGGYTFGGWYLDQEYKTLATEGADLESDVTLYAKWIEPRAINGTVEISGTYILNGVNVPVNQIDKAEEAVVILQEIRNGGAYEVDSERVVFVYGEDENGSAAYSFTGIPAEGKEYQISILVLNYGTTYDNESDTDHVFTAGEYAAVFGVDNEAVVDAHLEFTPPSYYQTLKVNAEQISVNFRPKQVLSKVLYRDTGDIHPFTIISQHRDSDALGVNITLINGTGSGTESIWKWHTDGKLYDYQMNVTQVDGAVYDSDTAPYYITYTDPVYWNADTGKASGDMVATLIPKQYLVTFLLNAGDDEITGMDAYKIEDADVDEAGNTVVTNTYATTHTWSFDTAITAVPVREGYTFLGWSADPASAYTDGKIPAAVHQEVVLTAQWEKNNYTVSTIAEPEEGGTVTGGGVYPYGEEITVSATVQEGHYFAGWYEGEKLVSEDAEYTFMVTDNRDLIAKFAKNPYKVEANTTVGGEATGTGIYEYGQTATVTAIPEDGYMFQGWYEGEALVSGDLSYSFIVTADRTLTAHFAKVYHITLSASPEAGGTVTGGGQYEPMANITISAAANPAYYFVGWYDEQNKLVTADTSFDLTVKENRTFVAKFEAKVSYRCDYVYIFGYTDSEIGAEGLLLRGELAQMIYRLVKQNTGAGHGNITFDDTDGEWFRTGISYMTTKGAIDQSKSNAYPYAAVTRGETYKMICLGLGFTTDTELSFSEYATILRNSGYLSSDGKVTAKITRWEFCALFNAILGRSHYCADGYFDTTGKEVTAETYGYKDLDPNDPYYRIMMIATSTFTNGKIDLNKRAQRNPLDEYAG